MSPLKFVIEEPLAGRKEKTWLAPFEPEYKFLSTFTLSTMLAMISYHVCPAREISLDTGTGCPAEL